MRPGGGGIIPRQDFNMSQIITGREAVNLTISKWEIGKTVVLKKHWLNSRHFLDRTFISANADEFGSRAILVECKKIAFSESVYFYRQNENSISHQTNRFWEKILRDYELMKLFEDYYGADSPEVIASTGVYIKRIAKLFWSNIKKGKKLPAEFYAHIQKNINTQLILFSKIPISYKIRACLCRFCSRLLLK